MVEEEVLIVLSKEATEEMASLISAASVGITPAKFREGKQPLATWSRRGSPMTVECSSRPKKKGTAHHMKTRPKKTQPWDVKRKGPTLYPSLPLLPPDWTLASSEDAPPAAEQPPELSPPPAAAVAL